MNELIPFSIDAIPTVTDAEYGELVKSDAATKFLPRIQLNTKGKYIDTEKAPPGCWIVPNGDECTVLGKEVDVLPIAVRSKAMDVSDRDNIVAVYDPNSDEFKRIKAAPKNSGCMWGLSYLVIERKTAQLYELYFGNASGRAEADKLKPFLPRPGRDPQVATLKIKYRQGKDFSWHVPVVTRCSEPLTDGPDLTTLVAEKNRFMNPEPGVETEQATSTRAR